MILPQSLTLPARLAWRQLKSERARLASAIAGVMFACVLVFMQLGFRSALFDSATALPRAMQGELFLVHPLTTALFRPEPLPRVRAYQTLARLPRGPVIELPYWHERLAYPRHAEYMLTSTAHWQPLINGYSDHIPQDFRETALPLSTFPSRESFAILEPLGARYAVFHLDLMDPRTRAKLIERVDVEYKAFLRPIEKDGEVWLFEIVGWPR